MRKIYNLSNNWYFKEYDDSDININNYQGFKEVKLPHNIKDIPFNYFNLDDYLIDASYKRILNIEKDNNKSYILRFLGIAQRSIIYLNKEKLLENKCGYNEINIDITKYIKDGDNELYVFVSSKEEDFPPFGNQVDYLGYGGIYREAYLIETSNIYIKNPYIYTKDLLTKDKKLFFSIESNIDKELDIELSIKGVEETIFKERFIYKNEEMMFKLSDIILWDINNPKLYDLKIDLYDGNDIIDSLSMKYGFKDIRCDKDGFYLNGYKLLLRGLDRHQSYPYIGYAVPKNLQIYDARILKNELGLNVMRCSHYMNHPAFLDECDKLGLLVYEEIPGWQYIGNDEWKNQSYKNIIDMIKRDRNHVSIAFFGVRINESKDDLEFNKKSYEIAKSLDKTRIITGTRAHKNGIDIDDCYTYNNFFINLTNKTLFRKGNVTKLKNPYLITEYAGHMYPNKVYDNETRRTRASIIHKNVISKVEKTKGIMGAMGWVMSDYNTHKAFGGNDMICYHGVLDMFRNPKESSYTYKVFRHEPFIETSTNFSVGDYDGSYYKLPYIYTNCEKVEVYRDDTLVFKRDNKLDSIDERIFRLTDIIGDNLVKKDGLKEKESKIIKNNILKIMNNDYDIKKCIFKVNPFYIKKTLDYGIKYLSNMHDTFTFIGYNNDKEVVRIKRGYGYFDRLEVSLSHKDLINEDTYSISIVTVKALSNLGELLRYFNNVVSIEVSEGLELIGPKDMSLIGGYASFMIKNKYNKDSKEYIIIKSKFYKDIKVEVNVYGNKEN